jgi:prepilin peptidase CpaA
MTLLAVAAIGVLAWAAAGDVASRRIPNRLVGLLAALGALRLALDPGAGWPAAGADVALALAVFVAGAGLFRAGMLGGGDVKLTAAATLWVGAAAFWTFLAATALAGGLMALGHLARRAAVGGRGQPTPASLPYGVAIAAGGVIGTLARL